ncbi:NUDIX domain-containing protein [Streptomyces sp. NPDC088194]|uniref:NUDIX domain-containing protein n=1 Tax=Streptomyces sp. NPDC088194 TaxID=3154931 RepID=UPI0034507B94
MPSVKLRPAVRALILDEQDRILLCRHVLSRPAGRVVWAAAGGGIEQGETPLAALRREVREEVGLVLGADPPHVWHQEAVGPGYAAGYEGVSNDYFLVRTTTFTPRGSLSDEQLAAEAIRGLKWWHLREIASYAGSDLFSPRDLATPLTALVATGPPARPLRLGV